MTVVPAAANTIGHFDRIRSDRPRLGTNRCRPVGVAIHRACSENRLYLTRSRNCHGSRCANVIGAVHNPQIDGVAVRGGQRNRRQGVPPGVARGRRR
jgi:hypothetical protein